MAISRIFNEMIRKMFNLETYYEMLKLVTKHPGYEIAVVAKGDGREVGFQDGVYFSRFLKRKKKINNHALLAIVNLTLNLRQTYLKP